MRLRTLMRSSILNPNPERLRVMKKNYIALAVAATALLASCTKEQPFESLIPLDEGDVAFVIKNAATKSGPAVSSAEAGVTIPVGNTDGGDGFFLEETIESLNPGVSTKGAPAYTVNVGTLYSTMDVYAEEAGSGFSEDAVFEKIDWYEHVGTPKDDTNTNGWRYKHNYAGKNPWPDDTTPVDFYLNMPASPAGVTFTSKADKKFVFTYDSSTLTTAGDVITESGRIQGQQDILFSQTSISKEDHDGYLPNGAPVLMYHALTGVKFRTGWANDTGTKTIITGVRWKGLKSKGDCTVDFGENASKVVAWTPDESSTSTIFSQTFANPAYSQAAGVDGTVGYTKDTENTANNKFGDSWYAAANDKNLNDADGTLTFWFVPQEITNNVTLEVTFLVKTKDTPDGKEEVTHTINFGQELNNGRSSNVIWEAGQLRTYTLKPRHVDVDVYDTMNGTIKSDLHITNTGNVDQYVRVYIIGNWFGKRQIGDNVYNDYESILMGYTDNVYDTDAGDYANYIEVARWNDKDFRWSGTNKVYEQWNSPNATYNYTPYGEFVGLPEMGTATAPGTSNDNNWVRHDKFYYYTQIIGPGGRVPETDPLFETYTIGPSPNFWIADMAGVRRLAKDVHFVMDISVQAIEVPYNGSTPVGYEDAWKAALGVDNINDL